MPPSALFSSILPNQIGYTLDAGNLRLKFVSLAGTGAYGLVYLAQDTRSPTLDFYAVKTMLKYEPQSELAAIQERELSFHERLSHHPSIATLHQVVHEEHYVYLVMDYHGDGDLFSAIMERRTFAEDDLAVKSAIIQIIDAVQACHDQGIAHRDLKPENILCSENDTRFYLADFGLSTMSESSMNFGCGSAFYMSPGTFHHDTDVKYDTDRLIEVVGSVLSPTPYAPHPSDVWSIGIILVNMLTGRNPWHLASSFQDSGYVQYLRKRAGFLTEALDMSPEAAALLTRILEPNVAQRITLPELRLAIQSTDHFFPRKAALRVCEPVKPDASWSVMNVTFSRTTDDETPSIIAPFESLSLGDTSSEARTSDFINRQCSESSAESSGPTTPETHSFDPSSIVPHLALADVFHPETADIAKPQKAHSPRNPRVQKTVQRFMGVLHRINLLS